MIEKIIKQALEFLEQNEFEKSQNVLLENLSVFSKEAQVEILSSIIEAKLKNQIDHFKKINLLLEDILKNLEQ